MAENQQGTFVINGSKPGFYPVTYGVFVFTEQPGGLFHSVTAVDFNETGIRVAFPHSLPSGLARLIKIPVNEAVSFSKQIASVQVFEFLVGHHDISFIQEIVLLVHISFYKELK